MTVRTDFGFALVMKTDLDRVINDIEVCKMEKWQEVYV